MNGNYGVVFAGTATAQRLTATGMPFTTSKTMIFFFVLNISSNPSAQNILSIGGAWASGSIHSMLNTGKFQMALNPVNLGAGTFYPTGTIPINTPFIVMYYYSTQGNVCLEFIRINGTSSNKNTPAASEVNINGSQFDIGGWITQARTINGGICDLLMYDYALSESQIWSIESHLSSKWNIAVTQGTL